MRLVIAALVIMITALVGLIVRQTTDVQQLAAETSQPCMGSEATDRVRVLMLEAVEQAFKDHIMHLFDIWLKDNAAEPVRAQKGIRLGVSAYARSRESALRWQPPCML